MTFTDPNSIGLSTGALTLHAAKVPWDSEVFDCPVVAISRIAVASGRADEAQVDFERFRHWLDEHAIRIATCRLPHDALEASMLLEYNGFKFIEMVLHPTVRLDTCPATTPNTITGPGLLTVAPADEDDVPSLAALAASAFGHERYHIDPRIDSHLADLRYARWVKNSFRDPRQQLLKIALDNEIVGMFVVEDKPDGSAYWHLTAVHPDFQGRQLGPRIWLAVMQYHRKAGRSGINTTISARNARVLGLYAKLNYKFMEAEMTFHWVRQGA